MWLEVQGVRQNRLELDDERENIRPCQKPSQSLKP